MRPGSALLVLLISTKAFAQLPSNTPAVWFRTNLFAVSFLQSTSSDWALGPQNFIAAKISIRQRLPETLGPLRIVNTLTVDLGVRQTSDSDDIAPVRVGENEMFGESRMTLPCGWSVDPYFCVNFRTPLTESYRYTDHPERTGNIWDPVVSYESAGLQYLHSSPMAIFTARCGIALKQTRAHDNTQLTDNLFTDPVERYKAESGVELVSEATLVRDTTITATGKLALFTTFTDPDVVNVRWESELRYRIWRFVGLTVTLQAIYDASQMLRLQFRQSAMITFFAEA